MQITLTIPDDIAAQAHARGLSVEAYVQDLLEKARSEGQQPPHARTREEIQAFFRAMAEGSERCVSYQRRASPARVSMRTAAE